ncbi:MAG: glycosyltransferase family A protein [Ornithinibacter sp.]
MNGIHHLVVSVPAHNEEEWLSRCLASVDVAVEALHAKRPDIDSSVCVGLDRCTDRSEEVTTAHGALWVRSGAPGVGAARDAAILLGLGDLRVTDLDRVWLACTDADTIVDPNWLVRHVMWAERGINLLVGTVEPHGELNPSVLALWHDLHDLVEDHGHVHGANLGIRGSHWRLAGGFGDLVLHEDADLVARVRSATERWVATDTVRVRTSGRLSSRVQGGFATFLAQLDPVT